MQQDRFICFVDRETERGERERGGRSSSLHDQIVRGSPTASQMPSQGVPVPLFP